MEFFPEIVETVVRYGFFVGFIGIGFGLIVGVACHATASIVSIALKIIK